ncbi:ATP-dependent RNA helicase ECM16 [Aspergillus brunneoviolaceus CBS 621.78]|uniref:P-loop containing nucleoside triphosphate hydrolase protein n=1 Tax=Aspergillus brunneoviolaceus CBS 621.78 TaxID=1450534 RepID=A0ACD1FW44_9EURO|nr:P-loop containing nucleoside triphosphate hydrolase protein [Aspergillus brunneoviolaceus CBS 621.78]RAH41163.1 P-loop containing nucleoside triphosphate hydrolase protein [Aspergillus brunneoviolaceus CBS 621.78]
MPKFVPRQRKQKHRQQAESTAGIDTNAAEILPVSKSEKEAKRQKLKEELKSQNPTISSKKQKRLDKYIETKLKKEENIELLKKLAQSKVDTSALQSTKELGKRKRPDERPPRPTTTDRNASHVDYSSGDETDDSLPPAKSIAIASTPAESQAVGSGLKRPLELGPDGFPILKKRKRAPKKKPIITISMPEVPWDGFGSDDEGEKEEEEEVEEDEADEEHSGEDSDATSEDDTSEDGSGSGSDEDEDEDGESNDDEEEDEEDEDDDEDEEHTDKTKSRLSAFKDWARQQINEAVGFTPATVPVVAEPMPFIPESKRPVRNTVYVEEPLPRELQVTTGDPNRKAFSVQVNRSEEIQQARLGLPVVGEEQKIMEAIYNNPSIVIWGATGSGKTTQLPQFLFEAGYGHPDGPNPGIIAVTQPRRVAAVSMAKRVGDELGQFSDRVSYQIRFDSTATSKTAIKFMTDGILIREIAEDFSLKKYSVIVIDEAHERSVNTDILIGMVSRIVDLRKSMSEEDPSVKPLKLVIMSATLRISDFTQNPSLFRQGPPPLVQAEGRQYPVTIHFSRRTHRDYVEESFRKVSRGHRKLPPGGILVFLTGQNEIRQLSKRLKQAFKPTQRADTTQVKVQISANDAPLETEDLEIGGADLSVPGGEVDDESDYEITGLDEPDEEDEEFDLGEEAMSSTTRVHVLPLYSQLPTKEQLKIFEEPPEGSRLIVLATNVAETSLTIPGIKYVFDCGRAKEKQYDLSTGVQKFQIEWISKASANQRAGRAGRTGPGHCYRLYSSAIYENEFAEYTDPEILRTPIEGVVLQMKSMGLHNVINFPFPTPPSRQGLAKAEKLLKNLGALTSEGKITQIGNRLSTYPLSPRFGKMLYVGHQHGCMQYVIALVAALAVGDLFVPQSQIDPVSSKSNEHEGVYTNADRLEDTAREQRHKDYARAHRLFSKHDDTSDAMKYLSAICAYGYASDGDSFCEKMFLRAKAFKEATQLRRQLTDIVRTNNPGLVGAYQARLPEPSEKQVKALKQIITAGFIDNVALRADLAPVPPEMARTPKRAIDVPYFTLMRSREGPGLELNEKCVYVHPSSILAQMSAKEMPQYIVYSHLQQSSPSVVAAEQTPKIRMYPLATPSGLQLSAIAHNTPLIEYGKPIGKAETIEGIPERRSCWVIPSLVGEAGGPRWPLPAKKVIQKKDPKEGWVIEKFVT